jgi:hypothetical protein
LKIIRPEIAGDATTAARFEQEVLLARKVVHPKPLPHLRNFSLRPAGAPFSVSHHEVTAG